MFMVRTPAMEDAERDGGVFIGHIGDVELVGDVKSSSRVTPAQGLWLGDLWNSTYRGPLLLLILSCCPFAIIGGLSGFRKQNSTPLQQGFTMAWLAFGTVSCGVNVSNIRNPDMSWSVIFWISIGVIPAIGAMVVVGMMLRDYGICSLLP